MAGLNLNMLKVSVLKFRFLALCIAFTTVAIFMPSCRKNTECTATVIVTDGSTGAPVTGASVRLYTSVSKTGYSNIEQTEVTDAGGQAVFVFKQQGIFDIDVTKGTTKPKAGVIKLEPGKSVSKDVTFP